MLRLSENQRTGPDQPVFTKWLLELGNDELPKNDQEEIEIPSQCIVEGDLIDEMFGETLDANATEDWANTVILCPKNDETLQINDRVLDRMTGI